MQRLRDLLDSKDPAVAELAGLVRSVRTLDPPPDAQDRVRDALAARAEPRPWWRRPVLVRLIAVISVSAAIAVVDKLLPWPGKDPALRELAVRHAPPAPAPEPRESPVVPAAPSPPPVAVLPKREERVGRDSRTPAGGSIAVAQVERKPAAPRPRPPDDDCGDPPCLKADPSRPGSRSDGLPAASERYDRPGLTPSPEEFALWQHAVRLLRSDHDVRAAIRELEECRQRFPYGPFAEDVLALTIEAFTVLDHRMAGVFANEYLRRFPNGWFRDEAVRMRNRFVRPPQHSDESGLLHR